MEVVSSLAGKVMDLLFGLAKKEIGYVWNCSENVKTFREEVEKLTAMEEMLQRRIDVAKREGRDPGKDLENWMKNANVKISEATKLVNEEEESNKTCCNLRFCVNLSTLYHYGKMMTKKTTSLQQFTKDGEHFKNCVFDPLPTPGFIDLYQTKDLEDIHTQNMTLKRIIQAVRDLQVVGIVGLGGVGKTTIAKEAAAAMKDQFDFIESITVSQNIDAERIKKDAEAASKNIKDGKKVLIILDDVWEELKLDEVGIPCGSCYMNCKILLTSRNEFVCKAMNAKMITLNPLKEKEAWTLFERVVGEREWDEKLKKVASDIVKECNGLPLFIQAVGKTLKNKDIKSWLAVLNRLQDPTDEDARFKRDGIMQLKLSYDYLESEVSKSCFLLCSMFPEDATIVLERLIYYGLALGIFNNPECNIQEAKHRVQIAVDSLKSSFLLLEESKNSFKMHDLVRDMAIVITSKGNDKFYVQSRRGLREWQPKKHFESYKKISVMRNRISKLSNHELVFPDLDTFLIQDNYLVTIHDEFFRGMKKLKLLDVSGNKISSLPQSLSDLTKLHTLNLSENKDLREISILGLITCLEILQLRGTGITNIPGEIGQLTNLMLLDVYFCEHLRYVTPGVISKLIRLEQLYVWLEDGNCNFLLELSESLKILHLKVPELHYIPEDAHFESLTEVLIKDNHVHKEDVLFKKDDVFLEKIIADDCKINLRFLRSSFPLTLPVMKLIQVCEMLILRRIKDLDKVLRDLYPEGSEKLKYMEVRYCENVRSLAKTYDRDAMQTSNELGERGVFSTVENVNLYDVNRLELIGDTPNQYISFCNLVKIKITDCHSLLELFPLSVAQTLVNLRGLEVTDCIKLAVVISTRDEQTSGSKTEIVKQDADVVFPLTCIILENLPSLESFYSGYSTIEYPSLKVCLVYDCGIMRRWSYGETHIPNIKFEMERRQYSNINDYIAAQLEVTREIEINEMSYWDDGDGYPSFTRSPLILQQRAVSKMLGKMSIECRNVQRIDYITLRAAKHMLMREIQREEIILLGRGESPY